MPLSITGGTTLTDAGLIADTTVRCADGRIDAIGGDAGDAAVLDAGGRLVLPGMVDLHADAVERAWEPRPGVRLPLDLALTEHDGWLLAAGVTTCFVSLTDGFEPGLRSRAAVRTVIDGIAAAEHLRAHHLVHVRREVCAEADAAEIASWIADRRIHLLSRNDHVPLVGDGAAAVRFRASLARRLAGDQTEADRLAEAARARRAAGEAACDALCQLARRHGVPIAAHDDETPTAVAASARRGAAISEFPADIATAQAARAAGLAVLVGAPNIVRGGSHVGWLSAEAAVRAGVCDALCSDYHHPCLLQAPFLLAARGATTLAEAWQLVSHGPARAAGLADRGRIAVGQRADLVMVEPGPVARVVAVVVEGRVVHRAD